MAVVATLCVFCLATVYGGGVTNTPGIAQFWTDDFKAFEKVYGKTSDKELYGATLPPSAIYNVDITKAEAAEKKERYIANDDEDETYPYSQRYANLFTKQFLKNEKKPMKFIGFSNFKPISQATDPETYNYLKHLEELEKQKADYRKYKHYASYSNDPEESEAYKSIQDILEAHEANKAKSQKEEEDDDQSLRYGSSKRSKVRNVKGNSIKQRCRGSRCRKRATSSLRVGTRPYVRKIKHRIVSY